MPTLQEVEEDIRIQIKAELEEEIKQETSELAEDSAGSDADVDLDSDADIDQLEFALDTLVNFSKGKVQSKHATRDAFEEFEKAAESQSQFQSVS